MLGTIYGTNPTGAPILVWHIWPQDQGQTVVTHHSHVQGAAEYEQGPGEGLTLTIDRSDGEWSVYDKKLGLLAGGKADDPRPDVYQAIAMRKAKALKVTT